MSAQGKNGITVIAGARGNQGMILNIFINYSGYFFCFNLLYSLSSMRFPPFISPLFIYLTFCIILGGSVAETLYKENYRLRLLTRHPEDFPRDLFPKAEICPCDMKKKEDMMRAFKDAECAFAVTQFWDEEVLRDPELEIKEGKNMADAANENKVQHFVFR